VRDAVRDTLRDASLVAIAPASDDPVGESTEGRDMTQSAARRLPGEDAPLTREWGGAPVTDDEALGTARRLAREYAKRRKTEPEVPQVLPFAELSGNSPLLSVRAPKRTLWFAHAKADMEGRSVSDVVREALDAYAKTPPGAVVRYELPERR
jgi:hypothetical protein